MMYGMRGIPETRPTYDRGGLRERVFIGQDVFLGGSPTRIFSKDGEMTVETEPIYPECETEYRQLLGEINRQTDELEDWLTGAMGDIYMAYHGAPNDFPEYDESIYGDWENYWSTVREPPRTDEDNYHHWIGDNQKIGMDMLKMVGRDGKPDRRKFINELQEDGPSDITNMRYWNAGVDREIANLVRCIDKHA